MKKSVLIRVSCLCVATVMLVGSLAVAAYLGSPYETLKKAVIDATVIRNVTMESVVTVSVNGEVIQQNKDFFIHGDNSFLNYHFDSDGNQSGFRFYSDNLSVFPTFLTEDGTQWYYADIWQRSMSRHGFISLSPEDRHSTQMRFAEVLIDAVVGNLKNNVTMTSQNGIRRVQATLTENQLPELFKLGIELMIEQNSHHFYLGRRDIGFNGNEIIWETSTVNRGMKTVETWQQSVRAVTEEDRAAMEDGAFWYDNRYGITHFNGVEYVITSWQEVVREHSVPVTPADFEGRDVLSIPITGMTFHYARGEAEIDSNGNLLSADVNVSVTTVNVLGETNFIEVNFNVAFSDFGTSEPYSPVLGVKELLTPAFMTNFIGYEYGGVYFTLNEYGGIDANSVTTMHPAELQKWEDNEIYLSYSSSVSNSPAARSVPRGMQGWSTSVDTQVIVREAVRESDVIVEGDPWY
jgi:hypothetical protein